MLTVFDELAALRLGQRLERFLVQRLRKQIRESKILRLTRPRYARFIIDERSSLPLNPLP